MCSSACSSTEDRTISHMAKAGKLKIKRYVLGEKGRRSKSQSRGTHIVTYDVFINWRLRRRFEIFVLYGSTRDSKYCTFVPIYEIKKKWPVYGVITIKILCKLAV